MSKIITLRKGLDINLRGKAQESLADARRLRSMPSRRSISKA